MRFLESISVGIKALLANKLRSLLTTLGIIIGIASVLAMIAIGDGAKAIILEDIQKLGGLNTFTLYRVSTKLVGGAAYRFGARNTLPTLMSWQLKQHVHL